MDELLFLEPVLKPTIWGGRRLADEWGYDCPDGPCHVGNPVPLSAGIGL